MNLVNRKYRLVYTNEKERLRLGLRPENCKIKLLAIPRQKIFPPIF